ncbi:MAG: class D beta-lactamase [Ferruginibacter sp.]|nr:class D beta-lactamase [Ferruginibacter sp.]
MKIIRIAIFACSCVILLNACALKKAKIDNDLKKYFEEKNVEGCFTMMDNSNGSITVYNMAMDTTRVLPASTFKIVNSLIGLETGKITNEKMAIKWDGIKRWNEDWNKDLTMAEAFKVSSLPYYQEVARRIGKDSMKLFIDSISYGNKNIQGPIDSFWVNNNLKISPDEQIGLLKRLYFDQLPFRKSVQQQVRDVMLQEDNTAYKLSYKTGWGFDENKNSLGWIVGWVEENRHVYFFATLLKSTNKDYDMKKVRLEITKNILKHYGFFQGKR